MSNTATTTQSTLPEYGFVNDSLSLTTHLFNGALRHLVKNRLGQYEDVHQLRKMAGRIDSMMPAGTAEGVTVQAFEPQGVPCRWYQPEQQQDRVLLYLHGGGFCLHMPKLYNGFASRLSQRLGVNVLLPDYRLAPEHPFPAAPQDAFAAYRALLDKGFSGDQIVVAGDSAGGCLALSLLLQIRDAALERPSCAVLLSPATQLPGKDPNTAEQYELDPMFSLEAITKFAGYYFSQPEHKKDPLGMPLHGDFHDLPPLQFHVGSTEILLSSSLNAALKAKQAGVEVDVNLWNQTPHVHPLFSFLPESKQALEIIESFIQRHLEPKAK